MPVHLLVNMLSLWILGRILEPAVGRVRFLALFLLSALGGSALVSLLAPGTWVVGASGAVWGLLGAMLVIGRHIGANVTGLLVILGINFAVGLIFGGISWQAHLGGLIVGAVISLIFVRLQRREQRVWQILAVAGVVVALGLIVAFIPPLYIATWA